MEEVAHHSPRIGPLALFVAFSRISLSGFGGTLFWARHVLVERNGWMSERDFVETLAVGQILPGPNVLNLTVMVGHRFAGIAGAGAALAGFIGWPFLVVLGLAALYERYGELAPVQRALGGMTAVATGLLIATAWKMTAALPRHWRPWLFLMLAFAAVGALRWPLLAVLAALAPVAIAGSWVDPR